MKPGSPKLKLRYLKLMFPDVDEDNLFDLLYNSDHDAREVINTLEGLGYRKIDKVAQLLEGEKLHELQLKVKVRPTSIRLQFPTALSEKDKCK